MRGRLIEGFQRVTDGTRHSWRIGRETLVGVCMQRSTEMLVGMLGILKAGGAYVPLDPAYPRERLEFMLEDSQAPVLLTQGHLVAHLPKQDAKLVCLDDDWDAISQHSTKNPAPIGVSTDLAYVLFTSGSTGRPKGVAIEHKSVVALIHWANQVFQPEELSGVLCSTSICFDLSIFELYVPLGSGGAVILVENILELPSLTPAIPVTLINTVPSAITELLRVDGVPDSVCTVNLAGEPLQTRLVAQIHEQKPTVQRVHDLHGPTEATTYSTWTQRATEGPATVGQNDEVRRLDRVLGPHRRHRSEYHGHAVHTAGCEPARHRFGRVPNGAPARGVAAAGHGHEADPALRRGEGDHARRSPGRILHAPSRRGAGTNGRAAKLRTRERLSLRRAPYPSAWGAQSPD